MLYNQWAELLSMVAIWSKNNQGTHFVEQIFECRCTFNAIVYKRLNIAKKLSTCVLEIIEAFPSKNWLDIYFKIAQPAIMHVMASVSQ